MSPPFLYTPRSLRSAQSTANNAEARSIDLERRLEVATLKQSELQKDLAGKLAELKSVRGMAAQADEANDLRSRLKSVLEQKGLLERDVEDGNRSCRDMSERAERAEATMREQSHELQRARGGG